MDAANECLNLAIRAAKPGKKWSMIAFQIDRCAKSRECGIVREFVGHGIGRENVENPKVPNHYTEETRRGDFELRPGLVIVIEPILTSGRRDVLLLDDGYTVVTEDRLPAAHVAHTVAITESGVDVLSELPATAQSPIRRSPSKPLEHSPAIAAARRRPSWIRRFFGH
jgi:methionyl aminopeptidase